MILKGSYDSVGDVPQEFKDSFSEVEGKFVFTGQIETKDATDYKELHKAKQSSFDDMHGLKDQLKAETQARVEIQSKLEVVELQVKDGADPAKLQELVETKVKVLTEELTKQLAERDEQILDRDNTIFGNNKKEFVGGLLDNFSDTVKSEAQFILDNVFERQEDNTYLTKNAFGLDAGLNAEQAIPKILEKNQHWMPSNTAGGATGSSPTAPKNNREQFDSLLKKQQDGTASPQEVVELSMRANQLKNEEN